MEPESAASTAAASTETAIVPEVPQEFEIPDLIAQMVAADASDTYQFKNFIFTVDKHVKFDVNAAENWQSLTETFDWAQKETNSCQDANYHQFLKEVVFRAKKGHYIFREDETLKSEDVTTVFFKARPGWKDQMGRNLPENKFLEHVKPIVKALGKYMYQTFKKNQGEAMNKTWDHEELMELILKNTWKHKEPPNFGWTVDKMHLALSYDPITYESDPTAHTCKLLNWGNVVNYHLEKDFDPSKPQGEWAQAAQGKGRQQHAGSDSSSWVAPAAKGTGKGPGKYAQDQGKESTYNREDDTYKGSAGWKPSSYSSWDSWGPSSSSWDGQGSNQKGNKGKGANEKGDRQQW